MICFNCGNENKENVINCEYCGKELPKKEEFNKGREVTTKHYIMIILMLLIPIVILLTSTYVMLNFENLIGLEKEKPVNSEQTTGYLNEFEDCYKNYDDKEREYCKAVYIYEVDGIEYSIKTHFSSPKKDHDEEAIIHYNKENPEESSIELIKDDFSSGIKNTMAIIYMFLIVIVVGVIIVIAIIFIKVKKNKNKRWVMYEKKRK